MHVEIWNMYFPEEELTPLNESSKTVCMIKDMLETTLSEKHLDQVLETGVFHVSFQRLGELVGDECLDKNIGNVLLCASCAVSELLYDRGNSVLVGTRITTFHSQGKFKDIDTANLGKVVFMMGTVCRVGFKKIVSPKMYFECGKCGEVIRVDMKNNVYEQPGKCRDPCKSKSFAVVHDHPEVVYRDVQEIKVQELCGYDGNDDTVSIPKIVDCLVYDEFVGTLVPGDIVQVVGVLGVELESGSLYRLVVQINNLQVVKNKSFLVEDFEYQSGDFCEFREISKNKNVVNSLIHSLYPTIYGNELVKTGLVLALFGGSRKEMGECHVRSEIHVLIIGDPGLGKSKMLTSTCGILPKSSYISGNFTTTAGLTVSLTHDPVSGEYMADAGALVVADNGICCLDEFDKIEDHSALFEAMEEQRVTVAKGGVICSVGARSTIIAASNPRDGHFDRSKTISENLRFDPALLSRFDLIFVLLDGDEESREICDRILKKRLVGSGSEREVLGTVMATIREDKFVGGLKDRGECVLYPTGILRKYISYARANVFPVLSRAAKEAIGEYYLSIRSRPGVTTRDLESLVRITEARAKIELRSVATKEDAMFCIGLYKRILVSKEKSTGSRKNPRDFAEVLREYVRRECSDVISNDELCRLVSGFDSSKSVNEFIEILNYKGLIIKKGANLYKIFA